MIREIMIFENENFGSVRTGNARRKSHTYFLS